MTIDNSLVRQTVIWDCAVCATAHHMHISAKACCAPEPLRATPWLCVVCNDLWDTKAEAERCSASHGPLHEPQPITREAVTAEKERVRPRTEDDEPGEDLDTNA